MLPGSGFFVKLFAMENKRVNNIIGFSVVSVMAFIILFGLEVRRKAHSFCTVCGSMDTKFRWFAGEFGTPEITESQLSQWIQANGGHEHKWLWLRVYTWNVFGKEVFRREGVDPPVLTVPKEVITEFLQTVQKTDIDGFVKILTDGTEKQQKQAVEMLKTRFAGKK